MTVASEICRIQWAKADIKTAIEAKWVTVPSNLTIDWYACCIDAISWWDWLLPITQPTIAWIAEHWKNCICWDDPDDDSCRWTQLTCWTWTTLVRKEWSDPTSIDDWVAVVTNTTRDQYASTYYSDWWLTNWCTYHYRAFANVSVWEPSCSSVICLTPTKWFDVDFLLVAWGWGWWGSCYYKAAWWGWAGWVIQCSKYQIWNIDTACVTIWAWGTYWYRWAWGSWWNSTFTSSWFSFTAYWGWYWAWPEWCWGSGWSWWGWGPEYYWCWRWGSWVSWQWYAWWGGSTDQTGGSWGWAGWAWGGWYNYWNNPGWLWIISSIDWTSKCYAWWGWGWQWASYTHCWNNNWCYWGWDWWQRCWRWASSATTYWSWWWGSAWCWSYWWSWCQWIFIMRYNKNCWYDISWWCKYECWDYCIHCFTSAWTLTFN